MVSYTYSEHCDFELLGDPHLRNCNAMFVGTVQVTVLDLICKKCNKAAYFDGRSLAILTAAKKTVYFRELLDVCVRYVVMMRMILERCARSPR